MLTRETFKVAVVGLGKVGVTSAYAMLLKGVADELVLYSREMEKAEGEKRDLEHGLPFYNSCRLTATNKFEDLEGTDLVVFTAGAPQKPGQTRLDLGKENCAIVDSVIPKIVKHAPNTLILMVSNPLDVMTYRASLVAGLPKGRVFGSGTTLDTARFRLHLSKLLEVNPRSIHAYILGEHGDSSFPSVSTATVGGKPLIGFKQVSPEQVDWAAQETRRDAYKIIEGKGATYYGIGTAIAHIVETIARDSKRILPLSTPLTGEFGLENVSLSLPCILGRRGVIDVISPPLDETEKSLLIQSAAVIRDSINKS